MFLDPDEDCFGSNYYLTSRYVNFRDRLLKYALRDTLNIAVTEPDLYGIFKTTSNVSGKGVRTYMFDDEARGAFASLGNLFADLTKISDNYIFPETNEELAHFVLSVVRAKKSGDPVTLYTPLCPNWSMDKQGRYDFKSLGGEESFISKKFFQFAPEFLEVLVKNGIPYSGVLIFADWGMETEIMDKNTYGTSLAQSDIRMCFDSSFAAVDAHLGKLQRDPTVSELFLPYRTVLMTDFFMQSGLNLEVEDERFRNFFQEDNKGKKLLRRLQEDSYPINFERMGLSRENSDAECLENLVDYATFGQALSGHGIILSCESRTTSVAYNLPREDSSKVPMFFIKGNSKYNGVNIL